MKKDDLEYIDEETGREIAMREGIKICIIPSISRVGTQYILTAKIQETGTGDILRSEVLYVEHKDGIIKKLDQLSKRTRRKLGESRYEILQQNKPLATKQTKISEPHKRSWLFIGLSVGRRCSSHSKD